MIIILMKNIMILYEKRRMARRANLQDQYVFDEYLFCNLSIDLDIIFWWC
jgi:hypothetical protein